MKTGTPLDPVDRHQDFVRRFANRRVNEPFAVILLRLAAGDAAVISPVFTGIEGGVGMGRTVGLAITRRLAALGVVAIALGGARVALAEPGAKTVLFVCQFGGVKSAAAREVLRAKASAAGVQVRVISRGITPDPNHVSDALAKRTAADGINLAADPLTKLDAAALRSADIVVAFDPLPSDLARTDARDWTAMPSMNSSYDAARAFLDARLDALLAELRTAR